MKKEEILAELTRLGAVAVIRMSDTEKLKRVSEAIHKGGVSALEITMTTPNALSVIENLSKSMGDEIIVGVGSVLKLDIVETVKKLGIPVMPGAFTPTEIQTAYENGADIVKVFPADIVGMTFFKSVLAPMPHLKLMPTGGVTLTNAGDWLKAGACAVGVGTALLEKKAIEENNFIKLTENAKLLVKSIAEGRI